LLAGLLVCTIGGAALGQQADPPPATDTAGFEEKMLAAGAKNLTDFRQIIQRAKAKVFPAVVFIKVLQESHESGKKVTEEILGSGVIISATGEVVTNWHVVDKAVEIRCLLYDGRHMEAQTVGKDKDTDLALIQLAVPEDSGELPFAAMGDSDALKEGDFVMAMGAPWGMSRSVSMGIISCCRRYLPDNSEYSLWLQTDAAISPGNSGGPLIDTQGRIIGINTRGMIRGGDTGFAVPSRTVELIVGRLREHKDVNWSWTGLQLQPLKDFNKNIYFEGDSGVIVAATDPESPARRAGFKPRDRILTINDKPLAGKFEEDLPAIRRRLALLPKLAEAAFTVQRGEETLTIQVTPREKGKVEGEEQDCPRWNMTVKQINQFDNEDLYFYREKGVFIFGVKYPGNASKAGLEEQDIVTKIDGQEVTTLEEVKAAYDKAIANIDKKHRIVFVVMRNGLMRQIVLDFSRDYERD
jgi:serine protease Do